MRRRTILNRILSSIAALSATFLLNASIARAGCIGGFEVGPMDDAAAAPVPIADESVDPATVSSKRPQTGDVLITGGVGSTGLAIASTQLYSNATGTLVSTPSMNGPRAAHQALMFPAQNEVLVVGGFTGKAKPTGTSIVLKITTLPTGAIFRDNKGVTGTFGALTSRMKSGGSHDDRAFFPSVVLPSGLGFMPSGLCNGNLRPTAFTFDPTTNLFSVIGTAVLETRAFHTATLLNDGTVLIAGGIIDFAGDSTNTAEIFDPTTGTFTATTGTMTASRAGHSATLLPDGTVLIAGGTTGVTGTWTSLDTAEIYNPATHTFAATNGPMTASRWQHTATMLNDGSVLLAGGFSGAATWALAPFDKDAGDSGSWTPTSGAIEATTEIYDPTTRLFTAGASMAGSRFGHTATLLIAGPNAGDVLMVGGFGGTNPGTPLKTTELYNVTGATFSAGPMLKAARAWHTATVIQLPPA